MARIYYNRIVASIMTLDEVPARWREAVRKMLEHEAVEQETEVE